jgi:hypothetical protein
VCFIPRQTGRLTVGRNIRLRLRLRLRLVGIIREHGSKGISIVRSRCLAANSEGVIDREDIACAVVVCKVCRIVRVLKLSVVTSHKHSVTPVFRRNPEPSHVTTYQLLRTTAVGPKLYPIFILRYCFQ